MTFDLCQGDLSQPKTGGGHWLFSQSVLKAWHQLHCSNTKTMTTKTTRTATKTKRGALPAERVDVDVARVAISEWS